jgi:hypothetical protein
VRAVVREHRFEAVQIYVSWTNQVSHSLVENCAVLSPSCAWQSVSSLKKNSFCYVSLYFTGL